MTKYFFESAIFFRRFSTVTKNFVVQVKSKATSATYVVAESRLSQLPKEKVKAEKLPKESAGAAVNSKSKTKGSVSEKGSVDDSYEVLEKIPGASLVGLK